MKWKKAMPFPQKEFGFSPDTFNLFQEWTTDGERITRECELLETEKQCAEKNQARFCLGEAKPGIYMKQG